MRVKLELDLGLPKLSKKTLNYCVYGLITITLLGCFVVIVKNVDKNPIPKGIKSQASFTLAYPKESKGLNINKSSFEYRAEDNIFIYEVEYKDTKVTISEQPVKGDAVEPSLAYYQGLGLHPTSTIQTKHGLAVLINFYTSGSLQGLGQNAILIREGTMIIAHPAHALQAGEWKTFFNNMSISK